MRKSSLRDILVRLERAKELLREGKVHRVEGLPRVYVVEGQNRYLVDLEKETCTCPDWKGGHLCKHLLAAGMVEILREREKEMKEKEAKDEAA